MGSGFAELRGLTPKGASDDSNKSIHGATIPGECFLSYFVVIDAWNHLGGLTDGNFEGGPVCRGEDVDICPAASFGRHRRMSWGQFDSVACRLSLPT